MVKVRGFLDAAARAFAFFGGVAAGAGALPDDNKKMLLYKKYSKLQIVKQNISVYAIERCTSTIYCQH